MINIDKLINHHKEWMIIVESIFQNKSEVLDLSSMIRDPTSCELGKWLLSSETKELSNKPGFLKLKVVHQAFHEIAGIISVLFQKNNFQEAQRMEKEFNELSQEILQLLEDLKEF